MYQNIRCNSRFRLENNSIWYPDLYSIWNFEIKQKRHVFWGIQITKPLQNKKIVFEFGIAVGMLKKINSLNRKKIYK